MAGRYLVSGSLRDPGREQRMYEIRETTNNSVFFYFAIVARQHYSSEELSTAKIPAC